MKPVDLRPPDSPVVAAPGGSGSRSGIGVAILAILAVVGVAGYFAMGRVNTLKEEAASLSADTQRIQQEASIVNTQIAEAGRSQDTDFATIASNKEQQLTDALGKRIDYPLLERELNAVLPAGAWLDSAIADVSADESISGALDEENSTGIGKLELKGYVLSATDLAALVQRINSSKTMQDAEPGTTTWVKSNTGTRYLQFEIIGMLQADEEAGAGLDSDGTSSLVGGPAGGAAGAGSAIALEPRPGYTTSKAGGAFATKPEPSALELAASAASGKRGDG